MTSKINMLTRSISMANMEKREIVKQKLNDNIQNGEHFHVVKNEMTRKLNFMICFWVLDDTVREYVYTNMVDEVMHQHLKDAKAINCFRNVKELYPMQTPGDGNCLLHAVSLAMWSFNDRNTLLRRLVYIALSQDNGRFYKRWERRQRRVDKEEGGIVHNKGDLANMWDEIKEYASDLKTTDPSQLKYKSLEHIHVFALCNILRRPIIIISDTLVHYPSGSVHQSAHTFDGIYLPLLSNSRDCVKYPIVLGYGNSHFVPLLGMDSEMLKVCPESQMAAALDVVPLIKHNLEQRSVHFLLREEEPLAQSLLQEYLKLKEIPQADSTGVPLILCAELKYEPLEPDENLIWDYFNELQKQIRKKKEPTSRPKSMDIDQEIDTHKTADLSMNLNLSEHQKPVEFTGKDIRRIPGRHDYPEQRIPGRQDYPEDWSLMHETCVVEDCKYRASKKTHPFCHNHCRKEQNTACEHKVQNMDVDKKDTDAKEKRKCPIEGCDIYAKDEYGGYCVIHKMDDTPCSECKGKGRKCFKKQCSECYAKVPLVEEYSRCITPGCTNPGTPRFGELCCECVDKAGLEKKDLDILAQLPRRPASEIGNAVQLYKCKAHDCFAVSTETTRGYCNKHFLLLYHEGKFGIPTARDVEKFRLKMEGKRVERKKREGLEPPVTKQRKRNPSGVLRITKKLCATPGCAGIRCKDDDLCYNCLKSHQHNQPKTPVVLYNFNLPTGEESMEIGGDIVVSEPPSGSASPTGPKRCTGPGCYEEGVPMFNGLCRTCYNVLANYNLNKQEMPKPSIPLQTREPERQIGMEDYQPAQCKVSGCKYAGTPEQNGYCSRCYDKLQKGLILSEESKQAIKTNFRVLSENMQPQEIMDIMFSAKIFTYQQMEEFGVIPTLTEKSKYVLKQLLYRGSEHGYSTFIQALEKTNQAHLANLLRNGRPSAPVPRPGVEHPRSNPTHSTAQYNPYDISPVAKPCISRSCDRYGDPYFEGFCSVCARRGGVNDDRNHQNIAPFTGRPLDGRSTANPSPGGAIGSSGARNSHGQEPEDQSLPQLLISGSSFEENYGHALNEIKETRIKCRYPGCDNWGNPQRSGFCNVGHIECDK